MLQINHNVWGYMMAGASDSRRGPPDAQWLAMKWRMTAGWVTDDREQRLRDMSSLLKREIKSFKELTDLERIALRDYLRIYEPETNRLDDHAGADAG